VAIILYVDTDQLYMSSMKLLLEGHGFKVLLARTCEHMHQVLKAGQVDLALIDQEFSRTYPSVLEDVRSLAPPARTVILGMRNSDVGPVKADAYCARLDGPAKLLALLQSETTHALSKSAYQS